MAVPHEAVPWQRDRRNVDHAIAAAMHGWFTTACGTMTTGWKESAQTKRKCRKCVALLETATLRADKEPTP